MRRLLGEFRVDKEAEDVGPVIDGDGDHTLRGHILAVIARFRSIAVLEAPAEHVYQDRKLLAIRFGRGPNVEVEAVFAHAVAAEPVVRAGAGSLHASRAELVGIADTAPVFGRLRLAPAKVANRRLGERD